MVRNLLRLGYDGAVYPVSRSSGIICGVSAIPRIGDIGHPVDLAIISLGAAAVPAALDECTAAGARAALVIAAGFAEDSAAGPLQADLARAVAEFGAPVLGPNTNGFVNLRRSVAACFSPVLEPVRWPKGLSPGPVAVVAQSGGLGLALLDDLHRRGLECGHVISTGNEVDVDVLQCADYLLDDDETAVVLLLVEGFSRPDRLAELARAAAARGKTLVVSKIGKSDAGRRAAMTHTAHLAGDAARYSALFKHLGILEAEDQQELVDIGAAFARRTEPGGNRVAILTTSGGAGIWMADAVQQYGMTVPQLSAGLQRQLRPLLPALAIPVNPVDTTAQILQGPASLIAPLTTLLGSDETDAVVVVSTLGATDRFLGASGELNAALAVSGKPVVVYAYTDPTPENRRLLGAAGVPWYPSSRRAAQVLGRLLRRRAAPVTGGVTDAVARPSGTRLPTVTAGSAGLSEFQAKQLLAAWSIPVPRGRVVTTPREVAESAREIGCPVAVKAQAPDLIHKTDAGGVALGCVSPLEAAAAAEEMLRKKGMPDLTGFLVEEMRPAGVEMIMGGIVDEQLGPMVMIGMGGIFAELMQDSVLAPAPLLPAAASELIGSLRGAAVLDGQRGRPAADREALADALAALSRLVAAHRDVIAALDVNPVIVGPLGEGVCAVDAVIQLTAAGPRTTVPAAIKEPT